MGTFGVGGSGGVDAVVPHKTQDSDPAGPAGPSAPPARIREPRWVWITLALLAAAAGLAYAWGFDHDPVHAYYAAGVMSMADNWHAFVYGAFDVRATVSMDKLPGALWVQALSVWVFGPSVWAMVLPQVVESVLAVLVMFRLVRRLAGSTAGLAAAALFATTPVVLASARSNLSDPLCLLLVLLAFDAVLRAVHTDRLRPLLLAAVWIGLAFQAKMTEAWLPVPVLGLTYLGLAGGPVWRRLARGGLALGVLAAVSVSWMLFVTATPPDQRPYSDGSSDDSVFSQVFGYNGVGRFGAADGGAYGLPRLAEPSAGALAYEHAFAAVSRRVDATTDPGWNRLLAGRIGRDAGWLLPGALAAGLAGLWARRGAGRRDPERTGLLLIGGWFVTEVATLSSLRVLLPYYAAMAAAPAAALAVLGISAVLRSGKRRRAGVAAAIVGGTVGWSAWEVHVGGLIWAALVLAAGAGAGAAAWAAWRAGRRPGVVAVPAPAASTTAMVPAVPAARRATALATATAVLAVGLGPAAAGGWMLAHDGGAWDTPYSSAGTMAQRSPEAREILRPFSSGYGAIVLGPTVRLDAAAKAAKMLDAGTSAGDHYQLVFTSAEASYYVVGGARQVLVVGGYTGLAPTPTADEIARLISGGRIVGATVPGPLDTRYQDPRVQTVVRLCRLISAGRSSAGPQQYLCERH